MGSAPSFVAKQNLAGDGLHYEPCWFTAWPANEQTLVQVAGNKLPFGDVTFRIGGVHVGFEICEDAWVEERPATRLASRKVDVVLNPSASHFAFGI